MKILRRVAMQLFKISKLLVPCALVASVISLNAFAADSTDYSVGFSTVPNITIVPKQALDFGTGLSLASGVNCTLELTDQGTAASYPGDSAMNMAGTEADTEGANVGDLSGTGCATLAKGGTYGLYEISGVNGGTVKLTVKPNTTGTDFTFVPTGCVAIYDGSGDGDSCTAFTSGTPLNTVRIADAGDTVGNTGGGFPAPGKTLVAVGGTILTTSTHTAGQDLTESFDIVVTY
jgi:hypothetical protein